MDGRRGTHAKNSKNRVNRIGCKGGGEERRRKEQMDWQVGGDGLVGLEWGRRCGCAGAVYIGCRRT